VLKSRYRVSPLRFRVLPVSKPYLLRESVLCGRVCRSDSLGGEPCLVVHERSNKPVTCNGQYKKKPRYHKPGSAANLQRPHFERCEPQEVDFCCELCLTRQHVEHKWKASNKMHGRRTRQAIEHNKPKRRNQPKRRTNMITLRRKPSPYNDGSQ
jgi:hypothetical protein